MANYNEVLAWILYERGRFQAANPGATLDQFVEHVTMALGVDVELARFMISDVARMQQSATPPPAPKPDAEPAPRRTTLFTWLTGG